MVDDRTLRRLAQQNPWWMGPRAIEEDPHLLELSGAPFIWQPGPLGELDLRKPSVYTIRGPRQVGKTTLLKMLVRRLLDDGHPPDRILYYSLDLERDPGAIVDIVTGAKSLGRSRGRWCVLLDEISSVRGWQRGVKFLRDQTDAADDCFVLTGSSAADIRAGAERLPGRRGPGRRLDRVMLPMSFSEFCALTGLPEAPEASLTLRDFLGPKELGPWLLRADELDAALQRYAGTGGFPRAVRDAVETGAPTAETFDGLWAVLGGDVERAGRDRLSALRVLERAVGSLGSPTSWLSVAQDAGLGSPHTAES